MSMTELREPSAPPDPTAPPPAYSEVCPLYDLPPDQAPNLVPSPRSKLLIAILVALTLLLVCLLVTVVGLVLEVISLRTDLGGLDRNSLEDVKDSVSKLEVNMQNLTNLTLAKLNSLDQRVTALEVETNNLGKLVSSKAASFGITLKLPTIVQLVLPLCWLEGYYSV